MWITENLIKSQKKINQKINKNANVQQNNETNFVYNEYIGT